MGESESKTAICDAGPIIHLDELNALELLSDFNPIIIPKTVQIEIIRHRARALQHPEIVLDIIDIIHPLEERLLVLSKALSIDKGEIEALSLMQKDTEAIFLTDDASARLVGEELGYKVHGTIGIILRSVRKRMRTPEEVVELLEAIPQKTTLFLRATLLREVIQKVKNEYRLR